MEQLSRAAVTSEPAIYLALEFGDGRWKLAFTTGMGRAPRERTIKAGDLTRLQSKIGHAKERFGLPALAALTSCYEAGRNGFWLHRYLCQQGIDNHVVDSSSIQVQRHGRQAKTDRLDAHRLLQLLLRFAAGEREVWSIVHIPDRGAEDLRQFHRELVTLKRDRTRVTNRIKGLLASQGVELDVIGTSKHALRVCVCGTDDHFPHASLVGCGGRRKSGTGSHARSPKTKRNNGRNFRTRTTCRSRWSDG